MAIAQIAILVQSLQWLDCILIDALDVAQDNLGHVVGGFFTSVELIIQLQKFRDVLTATTVLWNLSLLSKRNGSIRGEI